MRRTTQYSPCAPRVSLPFPMASTNSFTWVRIYKQNPFGGQELATPARQAHAATHQHCCHVSAYASTTSMPAPPPRRRAASTAFSAAARCRAAVSSIIMPLRHRPARTRVTPSGAARVAAALGASLARLATAPHSRSRQSCGHVETRARPLTSHALNPSPGLMPES